MTSLPPPATSPVSDSEQTASDGFSYEMVVVTYRSRTALERMLAAMPLDVPLVVVDNADGEDGVEELLVDRAAARYIATEGLGFARAANLGARTSRYPYIIFGNPDSLPSVEVHRALLAQLAADPTVGACAAGTTDERGEPELGSGGWEPTWLRALAHSLGLHRLVPSWGIWARPRRGVPVELDWLSGACLAVDRAVFLAHGGFDERYFVYNEDMALGRRLRQAGYRQLLRADLFVPHVGAGSGDAPQRMLRQRGASMTAYLADHHGRCEAWAVRIILIAGYLARVALLAATRDRAAVRLHLAWLQGFVTGRV